MIQEVFVLIVAIIMGSLVIGAIVIGGITLLEWLDRKAYGKRTVHVLQFGALCVIVFLLSLAALLISNIGG